MNPLNTLNTPNPWRLCTAPMMDWSDRHCRYYFRLLAPQARLYTEMVTSSALVYGDVPKHLDYSDEEHPVALQLGGSDPAHLAQAAKLGARWGYDEINLNCGCPSERVQRGAFGACLMAEPALVADCVKAMQDAVSVPVTVKHRIGIDDHEDYAFMRDFVGALYSVGCRVFIVHARNAILKGLSPKENREIPPLKYDFVAALKRDFADATIVLNGGLATVLQCEDALATVDGVMLGRVAYHDAWVLAQTHRALFPDDTTTPTDQAQIAHLMHAYAQTQARAGVALRTFSRHMLGLYQGMNGARAWRRWLSDPTALADNDADLILRAMPGAAH